MFKFGIIIVLQALIIIYLSEQITYLEHSRYSNFLYHIHRNNIAKDNISPVARDFGYLIEDHIFTAIIYTHFSNQTEISFNDNFGEVSALVDNKFKYSKICYPINISKSFKTGELCFYTKRFASLPIALMLIGSLTILQLIFYIRHKKQTERKIKQAKIASRELEVSKAIVRTSQMLAHDIRKPFALLTALTDMIQGSKDQNHIKTIIRKNLPTIKSASSSVNVMLQDIMDVGRAELNLVLEPQSLKMMISDCLRKVFCFTYGHSIIINTEDMKAGKVHINAIKIERVLINIFSNAMEQMGREGEIWISTTELKTQGMVQVAIRNSGSFIAEEEREKIFNSFYTKGKAWGTGLGLAISKKIVEAHGGKIWVESSKKNGTEFLFTLPAANLPEDDSVIILRNSEDYYQVDEDYDSDDEKKPIEKADLVTIAIIDDETIYRQHFSSQLKVSGLLTKVQLKEYANAELALKEIKKGQSFDIVILDLDLGTNMHGIEALPLLREALGSDTEIYLHSSRVSKSNKVDLDTHGASGFIVKPISEENLQNIVNSFLGLDIPKSMFTGHVLIIDDDPISGFIDVELLRKRGCFVTQFSHADAAIDALEYGHIPISEVSCIISDKYIGSVDIEQIDLPEILNKIGYYKPIYMASNLYEELEHKPCPGFKYGFPKGKLQGIIMDGLSS